MTTVLVIVTILIFLILGSNLRDAWQEVEDLNYMKGNLEREIRELRRDNVELQVELLKIKLVQSPDKVNINQAWDYLYFLAYQEHLTDFLDEIKEAFDTYVVVQE